MRTDRTSARVAPPLRAAVAGLLIAVTTSAAWAQTTPDEAAASLALVPDANDAVREGAVLYDHACSACHGDTGGGLDEARLSFPEGERTCTTCHKTHNPPQMDHLAMTWRDAFDVGLAPPLIGTDADLARFGTGAGLFSYLRATMPRPFPGSLADDEYARITAFLAAANGVEVPDDASSAEDLEDVALR